MEKKSKIVYLEYLRVISMMCVIIMHVSAGPLAGKIDYTWYLLNIITSFSFIAVPIFFMISGAVLLESNKTELPTYLWKKRIPKLIIPLFFWSMMVVLPNYLTEDALQNGFQWIEYLKNLLLIPSRNLMVHLWFMYFLIPLYILSPFLKALIRNISKNQITYFFVLWFGIMILSTICSLFPSSIREYTHIAFLEQANLLNGYVGYFLCGYFLNQYKQKLSNKLLILIIILDLLIIICGTGLIAHYRGYYNNLFQSVNGIFIAVLSICVFLFCKQNIQLLKVPHVIAFLSSLSFSVYLMHNALISILSSIWNYQGFIQDICAMVIVLCISVIIGVLFSSCKWTSYIATGLTYDIANENCNIKYLIKHKMNRFKMMRK